MKRKILAGFLACAISFTVTGCGAPVQAEPAQQYQVVDYEKNSELWVGSAIPEAPSIDAMVALPGAPAVTPTSIGAQEVRGVWLSYLDLATLMQGKTERQFTADIGTAFERIRDYGLNTVFVQVRPFADALYESDYYPWSHVITGYEGKHPGYDPLQVMVQQARSRSLRIEAWINPYRVRASGNTKPLSDDNQAKIWMNAGKNSVKYYNGTISYNPASADARNLIVNGVAEIVRNYDVDGVHIDDYFYPTTDAAFDQADYQAYQSSGGALSLADWRRSNVEKLIRRIYSTVKQIKPSVLFGISPQSSVQNNYNAQYLDVVKIAGTKGYCDYICPQIYFGYDNEVQPYRQTLEQWASMVKNSPVKLYVGIAAYKVGAVDSYAGRGKNEWVNNTDRMSQMVADARAADSYAGFALYRYDSLFNPSAAVQSSIQKENNQLQELLN